jgi:arylsulfatase A
MMGRYLSAQEAEDPRPKNIILLMADDLGYGDLGCYGSGTNPTPHLDQLARDGMRFTDFLVSSAVCSASRAALLTGCYHRRVGIDGALGPNSKYGISDAETTIAEICRQKKMATACFGKWHLGHLQRFLPRQHGFDEYFGLPYSNDMWPFHPDYVRLPPDAENRKRGYPDLPIIRNDSVEVSRVTDKEQKTLTQEYTRHAVDFIRRHADRPFFLYLPYTMVHVPLYVSDAFDGKSGAGMFADALMELDASVGEIMGELARLHLQEDTLVLFLSDNGPWLSYGDHAGAAGPLREGKGTSFEGGFRVPAIAHWPHGIPKGSICNQLVSSIDILPSVAALLELPVPSVIDGKDISPLLRSDPGAVSPHAYFPYYYADGELQAIRDGRWKLHFPHRYASLSGRAGGTGGTPAPYDQVQIEKSLFDLENDLGESTNVVSQHPQIVERLESAAESFRHDLGDKLQNRTGSNTRTAGSDTP